ncbi:hypothetical protein [Actinomycetospora sp. TBRC 11914]|uniref:hypothetical protein n=1 Tax=Actinomycetospora sp. TBRC 11914 TaxID=2729387 RepID=UPI00145E3C4C|nr:hypothetical protein [Actinomycetospora sp. TBRC 11914]NMO90413.1 hypothetical protein [Actinomycetospora sp. TBRC 11914]
MAIRVKLGRYERADDDPLGRARLGWFPRMTEQEIWDAGRGLWRLNQNVAGRERFALVVTPEGLVGAAAEIRSVTPYGDRKALDGAVLGPGHPLRDAYVGRPDPLANNSQNRITYGALPEEAALRDLTCACGCGTPTTAEFVAGHDVRAVRDRVRRHFAGSTADFLTWLDDALAGPTPNPSSRTR